MKKICFVTASPLTVNFFLLPHLVHLGTNYDLSLAVTHPGEVSLDLPSEVKLFPVEIHRKMAPWKDLLALARLVYILRFEKFDLVHSISPKAGLLAMMAGFLAGVPLRVHTYTGQTWKTLNGFRRKLLRLTDRLTATFASHVLADSRSQADFLKSEGIVRKKCTVLGEGSLSGVDLTRFKPDKKVRKIIRRENRVAKDEVLVLCLGRINRDKGVLDLAEAFAGISDAILMFVGPDEANLRTEIECLAGSSKNQLRFVGYSNNPENYMAAADILCLPSYREGFGSVIIEAGAASLPVIASRIYGLTDAVIEGKTGLLHKAGDKRELREKLELLLESQDVRIELGRVGQKRALREFSQERLTSELEGFYQKIMRYS